MRTGLSMTSVWTNQVGTVRVEFSSIVLGIQINHHLIDVNEQLMIHDGAGRILGNKPLCTRDCILRDQAGAEAIHAAPGDFLAFSVTDGRVWLRRGPDTETLRWIHEGKKIEM